MKLNKVTTLPPLAFTSKKISRLTTKDASMDPLPTILIRDFDIDFLPSPLTRKPSRGNNGTK